MNTDNHSLEQAADEYVGYPDDYSESYTSRWMRQAFFDGAAWFRDEVSPWRAISNPPRKPCKCLVRRQSGAFEILTYDKDKKQFTDSNVADPVTHWAMLADIFF